MNILLLSPYPPYPPHGGGAQRIYQLLRGLSVRHTLTCLTFAPDAAALAALEPLRRFCRLEVVLGPARRSLRSRALTTLLSSQPDMALRNASSAYEQRLISLCREQRFDLVQAESIEMAGYGPRARAVLRQAFPEAGPLLLLDQFNAEYLLQRRAFQNDLGQLRRLHAAAYSLVQWQKLAAYERALMRRYDAVVAVSAEDRAALLHLAPSVPILIAPNGVDAAYFAPPTARPAQLAPQLVFTGTMDYRPNIDAARWFVAEVLPLIRARQPDVRLHLVGRAPAPAVQALAADPAISVTGEVADVRPEIAAAAVYVVPMRIGGGVRLKLLEALSMAAPVVSTGMGAEGVRGLADGVHCLLADSAPAFAAAVLRLLQQPALAQQLGNAGRELVARHYDWATIVPALEREYAALGLGQSSIDR